MNTCLVFDLDDTLYPEYEYVRSGFRAIDTYLSDIHGVKGFSYIANNLFENKSRKNIFNQSLDLLKFNYSNKFILNLVDIYRSHNPDIKLYPDAKWFLEKYCQDSTACLITDGYKVAQRNKIKALRVGKYFKEIVVTDELGAEYWKPHEKPYLMIEKNIGSDIDNFAYIGDNVLKDFVTPNKLGWITVLIQRECSEYGNEVAADGYTAACEIKSLYQLPEILELL